MHVLSKRARPLAGAIALASLVLAACAPMPVAPTVTVMPGANKPFEVFMQDDQLCRGWAAHSVGQPGNDAAAQQLVGSTVAGAVIGGLIGAAVGDHRSAGAGAAVGTLVGATAGANQSAAVGWNAQRSYDIAYQQCMYSKGNLLPQSRFGGYPYPYPPPPPLAR
ncbi:MAG TPA: glycine zipper family protein [Ramlibacter sp.]|nr:glycine zipper family protein [Ramlibacter sp.]